MENGASLEAARIALLLEDWQVLGEEELTSFENITSLIGKSKQNQNLGALSAANYALQESSDARTTLINFLDNSNIDVDLDF